MFDKRWCFYFIFKLCVCMHVHVCGYAHGSAGAYGVQRRLRSLRAGLQALMSHLMWVLGVKPMSSEWTANPLNNWAIPPGPPIPCQNKSSRRKPSPPKEDTWEKPTASSHIIAKKPVFFLKLGIRQEQQDKNPSLSLHLPFVFEMGVSMLSMLVTNFWAPLMLPPQSPT